MSSPSTWRVGIRTESTLLKFFFKWKRHEEASVSSDFSPYLSHFLAYTGRLLVSLSEGDGWSQTWPVTSQRTKGIWVAVFSTFWGKWSSDGTSSLTGLNNNQRINHFMEFASSLPCLYKDRIHVACCTEYAEEDVGLCLVGLTSFLCAPSIRKT